MEPSKAVYPASYWALSHFPWGRLMADRLQTKPLTFHLCIVEGVYFLIFGTINGGDPSV